MSASSVARVRGFLDAFFCLNGYQVYAGEGITLRFDPVSDEGTVEEAYLRHVEATLSAMLPGRPSCLQPEELLRTKYQGLSPVPEWREQVARTAVEILFWTFRTVAIGQTETSDDASGYVSERCGAELVRLVANVVSDDRPAVYQPAWTNHGGWFSAVRSIEYLFDGKGGRFLLAFAHDD